MKLLQLYYEPHISGQTAHVHPLAQGLHRRGHSVTVVLPEQLKASMADLEPDGVTVVPLSLRKVLWQRQTLVALHRVIREAGPDIVHIHSQEAGLWGRLVAWLARAPIVVYTPQTIDIRRSEWSWLYRLCERVLAHITDVIVSVNQADQQRLISWGIPSHQLVTVPNGIDLAPFEGPVDPQTVRTALGLDSEGPLVMQVGRLSAQKDPVAFVQGAAQAVEEYPEAHFALVGDGPLRDAAASCVRALGLEQRVHLLGRCEQAAQLMPAADAVTLTSRWEGMPYALLEAMAWSRPVVATAVNGCPEIVIDGVSGFLVPAGDTTAWARAVVDLLADPGKAAEMGRRGRKRVEEAFTVEQTIARLETIYRRELALRHR